MSELNLHSTASLYTMCFLHLESHLSHLFYANHSISFFAELRSLLNWPNVINHQIHELTSSSGQTGSWNNRLVEFASRTDWWSTWFCTSTHESFDSLEDSIIYSWGFNRERQITSTTLFYNYTGDTYFKWREWFMLSERHHWTL